MGWSLLDIKKRIKHLEKYKLSLSNADKIDKIDQTIASLWEILDYYRADVFGFNYSTGEVLRKDDEFMEYMSDYNPYIYSFAETFSQEESIIEYEVDTKIDTSEATILRLTKEFYDSIKDRRFSSPFNELYKKKDRLLRFRKKPVFNKQENEAVSFPIYNTRDVYLLVNHCNMFSDYLAAIHEYGHAISALINQDFCLDNGKYLFIETDAILFEMLGNDMLSSKNGMEKMALTADIERFYDYLYHAVVIQSKLGIHSDFYSLKRLSKKDIEGYLREVMELDDKDAINDVIKKPMEDIYRYVISYMLAIELYYEYHKCPNKALDALYSLITKDFNHVSEGFLMLKSIYGIELGTHIHDYYDSLVKRVKEVEDDKGLQYTIK